MALRLNLGCGKNHKPKEDGWVNVDKFAPADEIHDLMVTPWPWADDSVDDIEMIHTLEHLGQRSEDFLNIIKECYRVLRHSGHLVVAVPHPRHDHFIIDPTHCRPVMAEMWPMFSKKVNQEWIDGGYASTPLAFQYGVNFEIEKAEVTLDEHCKKRVMLELEAMFGNEMTEKSMEAMLMARMRTLEKRENNVVKEMKVTMRVIK